MKDIERASSSFGGSLDQGNLSMKYPESGVQGSYFNIDKPQGA
jgi:hypothetical protein